MEPRDFLLRYMVLQREQEAELDRILTKAMREIDLEIPKAGDIERIQLRLIKKAILEIFDAMWDSSGKLIRKAQLAAGLVAIKSALEWDKKLLRHAFNESEFAAIHAYMEKTAARGLHAAITRMTSAKIPLSSRIYRSKSLTKAWLDNRINVNLARGVSWKQFARDIKDFVNPSTKGGAAFAAKRLARTEINNAYHAMSINLNKDKPWNTGMVWALSRSHSKPDLCDAYALNSPYELNSVPRKPHPQCFCYVYPQTVSEEKFIRELTAGNYNNWINNNYGMLAPDVAS